MYIYTIFELLNKVMAIFIFSLFSRVLSYDTFTQYSSFLIILGYFLEFSTFSYQNIHLVDYIKSADKYLQSELFITRFFVVCLTSFIAYISLLALFANNNFLNIIPIIVVFLLVPINIEFVVFGTNNSNYIVYAKFLSQISVIFILYLFENKILRESDILIVNSTQSLILNSIIIIILVINKNININKIIESIIKIKITKLEFIKELFHQAKFLILKILIIIVLTIELPVLLFLSNNLAEDFSVGNRLALLVSPFFYFYINSNIRKIIYQPEEKIKYILFGSILIFLLISPITNFLLLDKSYLSKTFYYNFFTINYAIQSILSFQYFIEIKKSKNFIFSYKILGVILLTALSILTLNHLNNLNLYTLIIVFYIKNSLLILITSNNLKQYLYISLILVIGIISNIIFNKIGYFTMFNNILVSLQKQYLIYYENLKL